MALGTDGKRGLSLSASIAGGHGVEKKGKGNETDDGRPLEGRDD